MPKVAGAVLGRANGETGAPSRIVDRSSNMLSMGRTSDAKERLLTNGGALIHQRGYAAVGIADACAAAGVKKGSFYHFFPSKVDFVLDVLDRYSADTAAALDRLANGAGPPLERLSAYFDGLTAYHTALLAKYDKVIGCPIGNLTLEMSTLEPELRDRLRARFDRDRAAFAKLIQDAIDSGDIRPQNADESAGALLAYIEGVMLLSKAHNNLGMLAGVRANAFRLLGLDG